MAILCSVVSYLQSWRVWPYEQAEKTRIEREEQEKKWKEEKEARSYDRLYDESQCTRAGEMELDSDGEPDFM